MKHKAKKSLGQNFLKSKVALMQILHAGEVNKKDIVLEIGPGKGALTSLLLENAKKVIAVEKDSELVEFLKEKFSKEIKEGRLNLVEADILDYEIKTKNYKLIANIPYNITGAIFKKFLAAKNSPLTMVLLVQKEVAERIVARDKKESILSISVKAYGIPKYIAKVSKKYFSPSPKVDSAIIQITDISKKNFKNHIEEGRFFEILKLGFAHKRKILSSNLCSVFSKEDIYKMFEKLDLDKNIRAENLSKEDWIYISKQKK